jgi:hypothetical protein
MSSIPSIITDGAAWILGGAYTPDGSGWRNGSSQLSGGRLDPAPPERQREFADLFARVGVHRGRGNAELVRCPWHDDRLASLSIDWTAAVFRCHASSCGERGGVRHLRELAGGEQQPLISRTRERKISHQQSKCPQPDLDDRDRLIRGFSEVCPDWRKAQQMAECEQFWRIGRDDHGHKFGLYPLRCHQQICTTCGPIQLAKDWLAKIAEMPDRIRLLKFYPRGGGNLRSLAQAFRYLRQKHRLSGGLTGRRYEAGMRAVGLLMLPADAPVPRDAQLVQITAQATPDEALAWLQAEYVDEALYAWSSNEELSTLLANTKGRRRFQAFGDAFTASCSHIGAQPVEEKRKPPSGGSGHGGKREPSEHKCPICGSTNYEPLPFRVPASEMEPCGNGYLWKGPPKCG